jgi:monooxygenase
MTSATTTTNNDNNSNTNSNDIQYYDALIIGAGISGISAAYHLQAIVPHLKFRILENRGNIGGTWDLFEYPGIRSDSDMYTFGYDFRPWRSKEDKLIAPKQDILDYLKDTVEEYGIEKHIQFHTKVHTADWDSKQATWTLSTTTNNSTTPVIYKTRYLFMCTGYYNYEEGYTPEFVGRDTFQGPIVHPQKWPSDLDYANKRIVVIGSGATAVTLIPSLTSGPKAASHVTMVQRSPTYMTSRPSRMTWVARMIAKIFGHGVARWYFVVVGMFFYSLCKLFPQGMTKFFIQTVKKLVGDNNFEEEDWTPRYQPWDQRLCLCPDGDFFDAIKSGKASIVTDHIVEFTKDGIRLEKNKDVILPADIIVTATGLQVQFAGGMQFTIDEQPLVYSSRFVYKGFMMNNVPNLFLAAGYTNASWTLKIDLTMEASCRLIQQVELSGGGHRYCQAELPQPANKMIVIPLLDLTSGYVQRAAAKLPKQSTEYPWRLFQNYIYDKLFLKFTPLHDSAMKFYK